MCMYIIRIILHVYNGLYTFSIGTASHNGLCMLTMQSTFTSKLSQDNLRKIAEKIIADTSGRKALKFINSDNDFLRGVARLAWQNIASFNMTVPTYQLINNANCIQPPQQTFTVPEFTVKPWTPSTYKPKPWTPSTYKPKPWTPTTRKPYPWTRPTQRRHPWTPPTRRRPSYPTTSRPRHVPYPQPRRWSPY